MSPFDARELAGGCHCGRLRYRLTTRHAPDALPLRACGCSFCRRHGARYTSDPEGALAVEIAGAVSRYRFSTGVVDFLVCPRCGAMPVALSRIDGRDYAVVNVNTLDEMPPGEAAAVDFSDESPEQATRRRQRSWIANVALTEGTC